jgi:predicted ATP-grasp superfamily ATP-dependent carboligase
MITILLTDPEQRAALAAARALGRRGWRVVTIGTAKGLAGASRSVARHVALTATDTSTPARYLAAIAAVVRREQVQVIIPVTDAASRRLLGQDVAVGAKVAGPSAGAYARASDKAALLEVAAQCGMRVPRQYVLDSRAHTAVVLADLHGTIAGAVVVKPAKSVVEINGRSIGVSVRFVAHPGLLAETVAQYPDEAFPLLIQERTFGDGVGVFLLRQHGTTPLRFAHRRLREKPPAGGVSTYREAIEPPAALQARCEQLLDTLGYAGPAMLEFKQDARSGEYVLMEINARLWGSLQLAIDAGVDFPSALVEMTLGLPITPPRGTGVGVRSFWELGELDHALALWRRTREQLHAPVTLAVGAVAALHALADHRWSDRPEVFRWSDPMPFVVELSRWIRGR